jgi:hypothetical protein
LDSSSATRAAAEASKWLWQTNRIVVRLSPNQADCVTIGRNNDILHGVNMRDIGTGMGLEPIWKTAALQV